MGINAFVFLLFYCFNKPIFKNHSELLFYISSETQTNW